MITWRYKPLLFDQTRLILILSGFKTEKKPIRTNGQLHAIKSISYLLKISSLNTAEKQRKRARYVKQRAILFQNESFVSLDLNTY